MGSEFAWLGEAPAGREAGLNRGKTVSISVEDGLAAIFPRLIHYFFASMLRAAVYPEPAICGCSPCPDGDQREGPEVPNRGLSDAGLEPMADASSERPYRVSVPEPLAANGAPALISEQAS